MITSKFEVDHSFKTKKKVITINFLLILKIKNKSKIDKVDYQLTLIYSTNLILIQMKYSAFEQTIL